MAVVKVRVTDEDIEKAGSSGGDFVLPPKGWYRMELMACEPGYSKNKETGDPDHSRPYLALTLKIIGVGRDDKPVEENYGNIWDYITFGDKAGWKRAEFLSAIGQPPSGAGEFSIDTDEVVGKTVLVRVNHESGRTPNDEKRARVAKMLPWNSDTIDGGDLSSLSSAPLPSEDNPFDGGDAFGEADEYLTEESLSEMDLKELGTLASEDFDIVPQEHIVKKGTKVDSGATKVALIAAILEAQGVSDNNADEDEDGDNPFEEDPF